MSQTLQETSPIVVELVGLIFIASLVVGLIVYTDIRFHDDYVGTAIEICHPTNDELLCSEFRSRLMLEPDAQIEIGNAYWQVLQIQAVVLSIAFGGFRLLIILVSKRKLNALRLFVVAIWAILPFLIFAFGIVDIGYYWARGLDIPDQLEWLDHVGFFVHTRALGETPHVDRSDLFTTFLIGVGLIVLLFLIATKMYNDSRLRGMV